MSKLEASSAPFDLNIQLSPAVAVMLATQFNREAMIQTLVAYTMSPEEGFVIGPTEHQIVNHFMNELAQDRLVLEGPGDSAVILDVLGQIAEYSSSDSVDTLMADVGRFGSEALKTRWYSLDRSNVMQIASEVNGLAMVASKLFERVCRPRKARSSPQ